MEAFKILLICILIVFHWSFFSYYLSSGFFPSSWGEGLCFDLHKWESGVLSWKLPPKLVEQLACSVNSLQREFLVCETFISVWIICCGKLLLDQCLLSLLDNGNMGFPLLLWGLWNAQPATQHHKLMPWVLWIALGNGSNLWRGWLGYTIYKSMSAIGVGIRVHGWYLQERKKREVLGCWLPSMAPNTHSSWIHLNSSEFLETLLESEIGLLVGSLWTLLALGPVIVFTVLPPIFPSISGHEIKICRMHGHIDFRIKFHKRNRASPWGEHTALMWSEKVSWWSWHLGKPWRIVRIWLQRETGKHSERNVWRCRMKKAELEVLEEKAMGQKRQELWVTYELCA